MPPVTVKVIKSKLLPEPINHSITYAVIPLRGHDLRDGERLHVEDVFQDFTNIVMLRRPWANFPCAYIEGSQAAVARRNQVRQIDLGDVQPISGVAPGHAVLCSPDVAVCVP